MKISWLYALVPGIMATVAWSAPAPGQADSRYQPLALFAPFRYTTAVNRYRGSDGRPGPDYWQNRADYEIHATLDTNAKVLSGREVITYINNSPGALGYVPVAGGKRVRSATIDPEKVLPDVNRENNTFGGDTKTFR